MVNAQNGLTDFTKSLIEMAAANKATADLIKEQRANTPVGTKAPPKQKVKNKEDKPKPCEEQEGQGRLF